VLTVNALILNGQDDDSNVYLDPGVRLRCSNSPVNITVGRSLKRTSSD
jgi:hypothetical protein